MTKDEMESLLAELVRAGEDIAASMGANPTEWRRRWQADVEPWLRSWLGPPIQTEPGAP